MANDPEVVRECEKWAARLALLGLMARIDAIEGKKFVPQGELDAAARLASTLARAAAGEGAVWLEEYMPSEAVAETPGWVKMEVIQTLRGLVQDEYGEPAKWIYQDADPVFERGEAGVGVRFRSDLQTREWVRTDAGERLAWSPLEAPAAPCVTVKS